MLSQEEKQDIVEFVAMHMATQGRPAEKEGACMYRDDEGGSCAIGCMLDERTARALRSKTIENVLSDIHPSLNGWDKEDVDFLTQVQEAHDEAASLSSRKFIQNFSKMLSDVCFVFDLRYPEEYL